MPFPRSRGVRIALVGAIVLALMGGAGAYFFFKATGNVSNPDVGFSDESTPGEIKKRNSFIWSQYGYTKDRRRYLAAPSSLRPPFKRVWKFPGTVLLEFSPIIAHDSLYLLKNNGALASLSMHTGKVRWKRKLGVLAASSPSYSRGNIYVTILERSKDSNNGRVVALKAKTGRIVWSRNLPSRSESSPLVDHGRIYLGSEDGTVYSLNEKTGKVHWTYKAGGAVKAALALSGKKLYFGDYGGSVHALHQADGSVAWRSGTRGARFGLAAGSFYSTPAVAYGRVYIGNTDGSVYSFSSAGGKLAWRVGTGSYVYASPAVATVPRGKPTVYIGSYDGVFYALDARSGETRWKYNAGGSISGGATVIGDLVYFSNLRQRKTVGLGARTGRKLFEMNKGAFSPVVSDGKTIFLNGYTSLYALRPKAQKRANPKAAD